MVKFFRHIWESKSRQIILNKQILFTFYYFFFNIHYKIVRYKKKGAVAYKAVFFKQQAAHDKPYKKGEHSTQACVRLFFM